MKTKTKHETQLHIKKERLVNLTPTKQNGRSTEMETTLQSTYVCLNM